MVKNIFYKRIRRKVRKLNKFLRTFDIKKALRFLPMRVLEKITGKKRYIPSFDWSEELYTHNIFRTYELIFGRKFGIVREALTRSQLDKYGRFTIERRFFTLEALMAHTEAMIRAQLANVWAVLQGKEKPNVYLPRPALAMLTVAILGIEFKMSGHSAFAPMFAGAIARDSYGGAFTGTPATTHTISHTTSGSNRLLTVGSYAGTNGTTQTGVTYNGVAMTGLDTGKYNANNSWVYDWYLTAPATGANNVTVTYNQSCYHGTISASYTGVDQTSPINAHGSTSTGNTNNLTCALTSTVADVWAVAYMEGSNCTDTLTTVNNSLAFDLGEQNDGVFGADSNTSLGATGSKTMGWSQSVGSNLNGMVAMLIAPLSSVDVTVNSTVVSATFSIPAPTVSAVRSPTIASTVVSATFSIPAVTVTAIRHVTVASTVVSAVFSTPASTVTAIRNVTNSPAVQSATFSIPTVNIITPDAQVSPSAQVATFSIPAMTVVIPKTVDATVVSATFSIPSITAKIDVSNAVGPQSATFSIPAPTVTSISNVTISAPVKTLTFSLPAVTVTAEINGMVTPSALVATFSIPAITVTAIRHITVDVGVQTAIFSVKTPRKVGGLWTPRARTEGSWNKVARRV